MLRLIIAMRIWKPGLLEPAPMALMFTLTTWGGLCWML